ncbi:MAG: tyrosine-type recombinase/integrase, partial [Actinomycetota bacterium]|nr:tyrosine-type recombinase/integrase [Actinomycetota bacterium]
AWVAYGSAVRVMKDPKTATSARKLALEPRAHAALRRHATAQKAERLRAGEAWSNERDLVFTDEIGRPLSPEQVSAMFRRLVKDTDLPPIGLHGLRHSFATVGLDAGVDVLYIAEALGHASPSVTQDVYQHTRAEKRAEAINKVGDAIFGIDGQKTGRKSG